MTKKKIRWLSFLFIFVVVILLFYFFLFFQKTGKDFYIQELNFLHFNIQVETKDFTSWEKASRIHFYDGWHTESSHPQSNKEESVIRFFSYNIKAKKLYLRLKNPYHAEKNPDFIVDVFLNRRFLKQIKVIDKGEFFLLHPGNGLRIGQNFIQLKLKNSQIGNKRKRFYNLEEIYFENINYSGKTFLTLQKKSDMLYQPANSFFKIAVDTSETRKLFYTVKPLRVKNRRCQLTVRKLKTNSHSQRPIEITFDNRFKKDNFIEFKKKKGRLILEFDFSSSDPKNFLVWEKVELLNKKKGEENHPILKFFKKKPHIFLIIIDAARFDVVNKVYDGKQVTPNINEFSRYSYNFTNFYANAPYTGPSVASMLTSNLPEVHGVRKPGSQLPMNIKTLPRYLNNSGYQTHMVVGNLVLIRNGLVGGFNHIAPIRPVKKSQNKKKLNYNNIKRAVEVVKGINSNVPTFVYFHFLPPHAPYNPPAPMNRIFTQDLPQDSNNFYNNYRFYLNNYYYADFLIGKIINVIKQMNLFNDSLIIITSDHGEAFGEHDKFGHITTNYKEMIHVPFLIKFPGQKNKTIIKDYYSFIDLLPTFAALLNFPYDKHWQGKIISFDPVGNVFHKRFLYSRAIGIDFNNSVFNQNFKYIFYSGRDELYDLKKDYNEIKNISDQNPFLTLYLKQKLFQELYKNLSLKKKLKIKDVIKKFEDADLIRELKTLGYL